MPDQNILMRVSADDRNVLRTFRKLTKGVKDSAKATKQVVTGMKKIEVGTKGVTRESTVLEKQAARMWRKAMTPLQKYKAGMRETTQLLIKQKLTIGQVQQVRKSLQKTLQRELGLTEAAAKGDAKRAARLRESAVAAQKVASAERIRTRKLERETAAVKRASNAERIRADRLRITALAARQARHETRMAGLAGQGAFGAASLTRLASYAAGVFGIARAVQGVITLFRKMDQERQESAEQQREAKKGIGSLAQLAETPQEMRELVATARTVLARGGAETLDEAGRIVFSLESAGAREHVGLFTEMRQKGLIDEPAVMARATRTLIASMGEEETGDVPDVLSKAFSASKFNPAVVEPLLQAAAGAGAFARMQGLTDEEVLAATAQLAEVAGSPETGGRNLRGLLKNVGKTGLFKGLSLREIVTDIEARDLDAAGLQELLGGRQEAVAAFSGLSLNLEKFDTILAAVRRAEKEGTVFKQLKLGEGIPEIAAAGEFEKRKGSRQVQDLSIGTRRNLSDATFEAARQGMRRNVEQSEHPRIAEFIGTTAIAAMKGMRTLVGDEAFLAATEGRQQESGDPDTSLRQEVRRSLMRSQVERAGFDPQTGIFPEAIDRAGGDPATDTVLPPRPREDFRPGPTQPLLQRQQSRRDDFFVPTAAPAAPVQGSTEARRRPDAQHLTPPGSPTLLTDTPSSGPAVQPTAAGVATTPQDPRAVVTAVDRLGQKIDQGNGRVVGAIQQQASNTTPPPVRMLFDEPTLGSPGNRDVNNPADPDDR